MLRNVVSVFALIIVLMCSDYSYAAKRIVKKAKLNIDAELTLPDTVLLNEPFDVVFNITILDTVKHFGNDVPDKVSILLPQPYFCEIIAGEKEWQGYLQYGSNIEIRLIAKIIKPCKEIYFGGYVSSGCYNISSVVYHTSNKIHSRNYTVIGPPQGPIINTQNGVIITVLDTYDEGPPPTLMKRPVELKKIGKSTPRLGLDMELIVLDTIILNNLFHLKFDLIVNDSVVHYSNLPDQIKFNIPSNCNILSGETEWKGILNRGSKISLDLELVQILPGRTSFQVSVYTGFRWEAHGSDSIRTASTCNTTKFKTFRVVDENSKATE